MTTVKMGWFIPTVFGGEVEITDEMFPTLVDHAEVYLRACGSIGWAEWRCLSTLEQKAFDQAGQRIDDVRNKKIAELIAEKLLEKIEGVVQDRFRDKAEAP